MGVAEAVQIVVSSVVSAIIGWTHLPVVKQTLAPEPEPVKQCTKAIRPIESSTKKLPISTPTPRSVPKASLMHWWQRPTRSRCRACEPKRNAETGSVVRGICSAECDPSDASGLERVDPYLEVLDEIVLQLCTRKKK